MFKRYCVFSNLVPLESVIDPLKTESISTLALRNNALNGRKLLCIIFRDETALREMQSNSHMLVLPSLSAPVEDWKEFLATARAQDAAWVENLGLTLKNNATISTFLRKLREKGNGEFSVETPV